MPAAALKAVYVESIDISDREIVKGYDFNEGINYEKMFASYRHTGF